MTSITNHLFHEKRRPCCRSNLKASLTISCINKHSVKRWTWWGITGSTIPLPAESKSISYISPIISISVKCICQTNMWFGMASPRDRKYHPSRRSENKAENVSNELQKIEKIQSNQLKGSHFVSTNGIWVENYQIKPPSWGYQYISIEKTPWTHTCGYIQHHEPTLSVITPLTHDDVEIIVMYTCW